MKQNNVTRRGFLGGSSSALGLLLAPGDAWSQHEGHSVPLRLLATSDIHMFMLDWDYLRAKEDLTVGFVRLASLIKEARGEVPNSLLFDNGDFLQGNPLAELVIDERRRDASGPHPIIRTMSALAYDAIGLGNHEFNYGLDVLGASLASAPFPIVCANVERIDGGASLAAQTSVLVRELTDTAGQKHIVRIGLIGFVPPQILVWDRAHLKGHLAVSDIVLCARRLVPELRRRCDIVVALSHSGIGRPQWVEGQENVSLHLASVPGIDAIITGHSHLVFPGPRFSGLENVDAVAGTLSGVPAVMPGFWGSHLGIIDLDLRRSGEAWTVAQARSHTRSIYRRTGQAITPTTGPAEDVGRIVAPYHARTLKWVEQPVGRLASRMQNYFVWTGQDAPTRLVNEAQLAYARPLLAATEHGSLPVLSAASPSRFGYTPDGFTDIPEGAINLRQISDIYYWANNTVVAVLVNGAEITQWLETAAGIFNTIDPAVAAPQPLLAPRVPSYTFDAILGLEYEIDVTVAARFDHAGAEVSARPRVRNVRYNGAPLDPQQTFLVVTNNYRGDGGGNVPPLKGGTKVVWRAPDSNQEAIIQYLRAQGPAALATSAKTPWSYAATVRGATAYFDTGRSALGLLASIPALSSMGETEAGYLRVAMKL